MKKTVFALVLTVVAAMILSAGAWADTSDVSNAWGLSLNVKIDSSKDQSEFIFDDTLVYGLYQLTWSGSRSLTMPAGKHGVVYGSINEDPDSQYIEPLPGFTGGDEYLYKFFYRSNGEWIEIGQLFNDPYSLDNTLGNRTVSMVEDSGTFTATVMTDGIGILYGAHFYGNGGSAAGTLGMSAAAVPEPSTLVGLGTGFALNAWAVVGRIRRKK